MKPTQYIFGRIFSLYYFHVESNVITIFYLGFCCLKSSKTDIFIILHHYNGNWDKHLPSRSIPTDRHLVKRQA